MRFSRKFRAWRDYSRVAAPDSKLLEPGPQLDLPGPGTAMLPQQIEIALRNGIRIEHGVRLVRRIGPARAQNAAVDDNMGDVDALRLQLPRHALRQPAQRELAHGER